MSVKESVTEAIASSASAPSRPRGARVREWISAYGVYAALLVLLVLNAGITEHFLTLSNLRLQLIQAAPTLIVALGMAIVIGTKGIDLSVGAVMALSAAVMPLYIGYGTAPAMLIALLVGVAFGLLAGFLVAVVGLQPIVATLAIMVGGRGLANVIGGSIKSIDDPGIVALGRASLLGIPYTVLIAAVAVVIVLFVVRRTTFGLFIESVGGNKRAAELAGVPIRRVIITAYVVCALLAAVAGVLAAARSQASDPKTLGLLMELNAIAAVVIGGTSLNGGTVRVMGTVAGALLMQLISATLISHNVPDSMTQMITAMVIVVAVFAQVGRKRQ
ncbi:MULTISPECIES: ABC transporter permease [unclassified Microbacterium]|uniref:ABC transporter permease n=1 Tax=unclassified Microbacterium TaxID=2609290 RepID=UPI00097EEAD3|nr:ABC transporter permease [Microbacterium sp. JB110]RCS61323.1 ABC transporter permease [Microbacterium sp. JB110]SJM50814.1 Ribose ABC transport system, permease protein RbsC (TC 3.A.1.2.1) [Frigoribacterium sp. JB110]